MPRRDKRADIVNAGIRVFSRKGFQRCSVEDILQEAKVARATFYSYFDSKKDLFIELIDGILSTMGDVIVEAMEDQPTSLKELQERTKNAMVALYAFFQDNLDFASIYFQEVMGMNPDIDFKIIEWQNRITGVLKNVIQKGIDKGVFREMDVDVVAGIVSGAPQFFGISLFTYSDKVDIPRVADAMAEYLIYGLATR